MYVQFPATVAEREKVTRPSGWFAATASSMLDQVTAVEVENSRTLSFQR